MPLLKKRDSFANRSLAAVLDDSVLNDLREEIKKKEGTRRRNDLTEEHPVKGDDNQPVPRKKFFKKRTKQIITNKDINSDIQTNISPKVLLNNILIEHKNSHKSIAINDDKSKNENVKTNQDLFKVPSNPLLRRRSLISNLPSSTPVRQIFKNNFNVDGLAPSPISIFHESTTENVGPSTLQNVNTNQKVEENQPAVIVDYALDDENISNVSSSNHQTVGTKNNTKNKEHTLKNNISKKGNSLASNTYKTRLSIQKQSLPTKDKSVEKDIDVEKDMNVETRISIGHKNQTDTRDESRSSPRDSTISFRKIQSSKYKRPQKSLERAIKNKRTDKSVINSRVSMLRRSSKSYLKKSIRVNNRKSAHANVTNNIYLQKEPIFKTSNEKVNRKLLNSFNDNVVVGMDLTGVQPLKNNSKNNVTRQRNNYQVVEAEIDNNIPLVTSNAMQQIHDQSTESESARLVNHNKLVENEELSMVFRAVHLTPVKRMSAQNITNSNVKIGNMITQSVHDSVKLPEDHNTSVQTINKTVGDNNLEQETNVPNAAQNNQINNITETKNGNKSNVVEVPANVSKTRSAKNKSKRELRPRKVDDTQPSVINHKDTISHNTFAVPVEEHTTTKPKRQPRKRKYDDVQSIGNDTGSVVVGGLRRTARKHVLPLPYWLNVRLEYVVEEQGLETMVGISGRNVTVKYNNNMAKKQQKEVAYLNKSQSSKKGVHGSFLQTQEISIQNQSKALKPALSTVLHNNLSIDTAPSQNKKTETKQNRKKVTKQNNKKVIKQNKKNMIKNPEVVSETVQEIQSHVENECVVDESNNLNTLVEPPTKRKNNKPRKKKEPTRKSPREKSNTKLEVATKSTDQMPSETFVGNPEVSANRTPAGNGVSLSGTLNPLSMGLYSEHITKPMHQLKFEPVNQEGLEHAIGLAGENSLTGYIRIPRNKVKVKHTTKKFNLYLIVLQGTALLTIQDQQDTIVQWQAFVVPAGVNYEIRNIGEENLILYYMKTVKTLI